MAKKVITVKGPTVRRNARPSGKIYSTSSKNMIPMPKGAPKSPEGIRAAKKIQKANMRTLKKTARQGRKSDRAAASEDLKLAREQHRTIREGIAAVFGNTAQGIAALSEGNSRARDMSAIAQNTGGGLVAQSNTDDEQEKTNKSTFGTVYSKKRRDEE